MHLNGAAACLLAAGAGVASLRSGNRRASSALCHRPEATPELASEIQAAGPVAGSAATRGDYPVATADDLSGQKQCVRMVAVSSKPAT